MVLDNASGLNYLLSNKMGAMDVMLDRYCSKCGGNLFVDFGDRYEPPRATCLQCGWPVPLTKEEKEKVLNGSSSSIKKLRV